QSMMIPQWAWLAFSAAILTSFNPILYKRILHDVVPIVVIWAVTVLSLPILAALTLVVLQQYPHVDWQFALAIVTAAGLDTLAQITSIRALKRDDASLVTPLLILAQFLPC